MKRFCIKALFAVVFVCNVLTLNAEVSANPSQISNALYNVQSVTYTIKGYAKLKNGGPLEGITVRLRYKKNDKYKVTETTGENGYFEISIAASEDDSIVLEFPGYKLIDLRSTKIYPPTPSVYELEKKVNND